MLEGAGTGEELYGKEEEPVEFRSTEAPMYDSILSKSALIDGEQGYTSYRNRDLGSRPVLVEVGVDPPGTHGTNQAREPKPKTGGSRAGGPYRGTSPTSHTGTGKHNITTTFNTRKVEEYEGAYSMRELAGELRWIASKDQALERLILVEARRMEDVYYNQLRNKAPRREQLW